jgi:hypothetical protein
MASTRPAAVRPSRSPRPSRALARALVLLGLASAFGLGPASCRFLEETDKPCEAGCIFPFVCCGVRCAEYKSCQSAPATLVDGNPCERQKPNEIATLERGVPQQCGVGLICCRSTLTCAANSPGNDANGVSLPDGCAPIHPAVEGGDAPCHGDGDCPAGALCCGINLASRNGRCTSVEKCGGISGEPPDAPPVGGNGGAGGGTSTFDCALSDLPAGARPEVCVAKGERRESGLVGYWPIDQDGYLCDLSGFGQDGSVQGPVTVLGGSPQAAGESAALHLDNANPGYLVLPVRGELLPSDRATVSLFAKPDLVGASPLPLVTRGVFREARDADYVELAVTSCGGVALTARLGADDVAESSPCGLLPKDTWAHLAVTFSDRQVTVFVNGESALSATLPREPSFPCADTTVGARKPPFAQSFRGDVDDLKWWNRVRTQEELCLEAGGSPTGGGCVR